MADTQADSSTPNPENWFVAQLRPNGVALALRNLGRQRFASFNPCRLETIRRHDKTTIAPKALFPGYLFVQFQPDRVGWQKINATRGVSRLILSDLRAPRPLPAAFMAGLMARCDIHGVLAPPENIEVGDRIRVLSGPFADLVITVDRLDRDRRIQVLIDLMGRAVRTTLPNEAVERITSSKPPRG